jgi:hypothetical protein
MLMWNASMFTRKNEVAALHYLFRMDEMLVERLICWAHTIFCACVESYSS